MGNVSIRKENEHKPAPVPRAAERATWDPFRTLRDLMAWDPFREMAEVGPLAPPGFVPSFEVKETKDAYVFKADVPGVKESDIEVTLTGNRLNVAGKREAEHREQNERYYSYERTYGDFSRSFTLPDGIDASSAGAELKDGVLTISIRKKLEAQPKKIAIQSEKNS